MLSKWRSGCNEIQLVKVHGSCFNLLDCVYSGECQMAPTIEFVAVWCGVGVGVHQLNNK